MADGITVKTTVTISIQRLKDLLCCAFEGGTEYWAVVLDEGTTKADMEKVGAEYYHEIPAIGGEFNIFDKESYYEVEEDERPECFGVLNMEKMEKALQLMADGKDKDGKDCPGYKQHWEWIMSENEDASTGDLFVQLALFGKEIYC